MSKLALLDSRKELYPLPRRQAAVLILIEPGREARIIPIVDNDSQEPALALLLERAQRMVGVDTKGLRR